MRIDANLAQYFGGNFVKINTRSGTLLRVEARLEG